MKLYYVVTLHLDSTDTWNGLKTIDVYEIKDNIPLQITSIIAESDSTGGFLYSDEEYIQMWVDENLISDDYEFEQL